MSEPFLGEIKIFAGNFAPQGWAFCDGQILSVSQNDALFALLGTMYGGDGRTTFALPDLRGRLAIHAGQGPGLTSRRQGGAGGSERVTLSASELASHDHDLRGGGAANADFPAGHFPGNATGEHWFDVQDSQPLVQMGVRTGSTGAASPRAHDNVMPFTCINYIIALQGIFPTRT